MANFRRTTYEKAVTLNVSIEPQNVSVLGIFFVSIRQANKKERLPCIVDQTVERR